MTDMKITGIGAGKDILQPGDKNKASGKAFDDVLKDAMGKMSQVQNDAEKAVKDLASGGDMTKAIISMEKADMSFQMMVEVRNKLLSAYDEIMRMQV